MRTSHSLPRLTWPAPDDRVESLLFATVQVLMFACTVLFAVQMLATA